MNVPKIDKRTIEDLYDQLVRMLPTYTPEWRFNLRSPDPGTALFVIFAEMFQETIDRFNKTPLKNYLAYLNMLDTEMRPVVPSVGYARFQASSGAVNKIFIPEGTKLFSDGGHADGERIIFETTRNFYVTPAKIKAIFNADPLKDRIINCYSKTEPGDGVPSGISLFSTERGINLQEHVFFLNENDVLSIKGPAEIRIGIENSKNPHITDTYLKKLADENLVEWRYHTGLGWKAFEKAEIEKGYLTLHKQSDHAVTSHLGDEGDFYISCCSKNMPGLKEISADKITIASKSVGGIQPEMVYSNDIPLDYANRLCFGASFSQYNCMYIKSEEVFTKRGARILAELDLDFIEKDVMADLPDVSENIKYKFIMDKNQFKPPEKRNITIGRVLLEYWNGIGWVRIETEDPIDSIFSGEAGKRRIAFQCPEDISQVIVNAIDGYWLRFRIIDIENIFYVNGVYRSPWLNGMVLHYDYLDHFRSVKKLINRNNASEGLPLDISKGAGQPVKLFSCLQGLKSSVYICFDQKPSGIPINLYFQVISQPGSRIKEPVWFAMSESRGTKDWVELRIEDKTGGFAKSGIISVESGTEMIAAEFFGIEGYWFKIERNDLQENMLPMIDGIHINTVKIVQRVSYRDERHLLTGNDLSLTITLANSPIIDEEVWVNEFGRINDDEINDLNRKNPDAIRIVRDDNGEITEAWVLWEPVANFHNSRGNDRHYLIDRSNGTILFGNGKNGRSVPEQDEENIMVNYSSGGGSAGNLPEGSVSSLLSSIAYIDSVVNIKPTCGGCDRQDLNDAAALGPAILRHRNRAVTLLDYEKLVKANFNDARKVKCISNRNNLGEIDYGAVTVVVMCRDYENMHYNVDLCSDIHSFLMDRAFCVTTNNQKIYVIPPQLLELNLDCDVVTESMEVAGMVEKELLETVAEYLDPFRGADGKGWNIGEIPRPAHFYSSMKKIDGIKYIERISLDASIVINGTRKFIALDKPISLPFAVPVNGEHKFRLRTD